MYRLYWRYKKDGKWTWKPVKIAGRYREGIWWATGQRTYQIFVEEPGESE